MKTVGNLLTRVCFHWGEKSWFLRLEVFSWEHTPQFLESSFTRSWMEFLIKRREILPLQTVITKCWEPLLAFRERAVHILPKTDQDFNLSPTYIPDICPNYWTFLGQISLPTPLSLQGRKKNCFNVVPLWNWNNFWNWKTFCGWGKPFHTQLFLEFKLQYVFTDSQWQKILTAKFCQHKHGSLIQRFSNSKHQMLVSTGPSIFVSHLQQYPVPKACL